MTTETKVAHTPGPWTRVGDERFRHDNSAGIKGPDGMYVAAALDFNNFERDAEVEANARLIAAAPELVAAVQAALALLEEIEADQRKSDPQLSGAILRLSRPLYEAIAKVEGRP